MSDTRSELIDIENEWNEKEKKENQSQVMTDYKNELEQILEHHWNAALSCVAELNEGNWSEEEYLKAQANYRKHDLKAIEALLSQHSKKRELEAETRLLEYLATSGPKYTHAAVMDELAYCKDRINQLGGQDETNKGE